MSLRKRRIPRELLVEEVATAMAREAMEGIDAGMRAYTSDGEEMAWEDVYEGIRNNAEIAVSVMERLGGVKTDD